MCGIFHPTSLNHSMLMKSLPNGMQIIRITPRKTKMFPLHAAPCRYCPACEISINTRHNEKSADDGGLERNRITFSFSLRPSSLIERQLQFRRRSRHKAWKDYQVVCFAA